MTDLIASQPITEPKTYSLSWQTAALVTLAGIVILAGVLRLSNIDALGNGNEYYTAAVEAMIQSPSNFFFAAAEPGGGVSIDKPPFGLWVQTLSAAIFGVNNFGVTFPSILAGMLSVALIYHLVSKRFGAAAGLIAAFVLATTPISIAVDGTNNLDSLLIFVLLLSAWGFIRAVETGELRYFLTGGSQMDQWVSEACTVVDDVSIDIPSFGGGNPPAGFQPPAGFTPPAGFQPPAGMGGASALYDCQPTV